MCSSDLFKKRMLAPREQGSGNPRSPSPMGSRTVEITGSLPSPARPGEQGHVHDDAGPLDLDLARGLGGFHLRPRLQLASLALVLPRPQVHRPQWGVTLHPPGAIKNA